MNKNVNLEDYVQFFDTDKFQFSTNLLRDCYEYSEKELNHLFENEIPPNLVLQRDPDADLDEGQMVDCSTYHLQYGPNKSLSNWELAQEFWFELTNTKSYIQKYGY